MPPDPDLAHLSTALHHRLVDGDPVASAEIAERLLPPLIKYLCARYPAGGDSHLAESAAIDALVNYLERPVQYDPNKLSLLSYLRMAAWRDLLNEIEREDRSSGASQLGHFVELDALSAEQEIEDPSIPSIETLVAHNTSPAWEQLAEILPDPVDYECVLLMMENVRSTYEFAIVLGITDLSPDEQAREVKRHKDRLKKRVQRHIKRTDLESNE